jgi:hypothetical protein
MGGCFGPSQSELRGLTVTMQPWTTNRVAPPRPPLDVSPAISLYDARMVSLIKKKWTEAIRDVHVKGSRAVDVHFKLHPDGQVSDLRMVKSDLEPALQPINELCLKVIVDCSPFERWPEEMQRTLEGKPRDITFRFRLGDEVTTK